MISWRILSRRLTLPSKDSETGIASQKIDWHCLLWWGRVGVTHAAVPTGILRSLTLVRDDRLGVEIPKQQCCHPGRAPFMSSRQSPLHVIPIEPLSCHPGRAPYMSSRQSEATRDLSISHSPASEKTAHETQTYHPDSPAAHAIFHRNKPHSPESNPQPHHPNNVVTHRSIPWWCQCIYCT